MLPDMRRHHFAVLGRRVVEDPLDEIVAVLVARNVNQRDPSTIATTLAHSVQVSAQKISPTNLQTLLNHLRGKLIGTVLGSVSNYMVNGPTAVRRRTVLANVLDAPVSKLAVGHNIDIGKHFFNARPL